MKRFLSVILAVVIAMALLTACSSENTTANYENSLISSETSNDNSEESEENKENEESQESEESEVSHTLYFKDSSKSSKVSAVFFNSESGKSENVEMKKIGEDNETFTYSCEGDTKEYNMAYITYGDKKTIEFAFNKCVSGWYSTEDDFFPYTEGKEIDATPKFDDVTLKGYGYDKKIHIWKPDDYDVSSDEKYSTIYVLDGQNIADFGRMDYNPSTRPGVIEQVEAMNLLTGNKAIIVAIESDTARDYELIPDIEVSMEEREHICMTGLDSEKPADDESDYECMSGLQFAHFLANKLVPYIQQNYNVYNDAAHTSITGNSLGGLESFYIAVEYPNVFGTVGSLSPSLYEFDDTQWKEYLEEKDFNSDSSFIYLYTGPAGMDTDPDVTDMYNRLKNMGYPEDKLVLHFNENGDHSGICWRSVFSEYLAAMVFQSVEPLQQ